MKHLHKAISWRNEKGALEGYCVACVKWLPEGEFKD